MKYQVLNAILHKAARSPVKWYHSTGEYCYHCLNKAVICCV